MQPLNYQNTKETLKLQCSEGEPAIDNFILCD